jgi:hypothetical protein
VSKATIVDSLVFGILVRFWVYGRDSDQRQSVYDIEDPALFVAALCTKWWLHGLAGSLEVPQRVFSSPPAHSFSVYPSLLLTSSTVALSPVFLPMLSLILTACRPLAEAILMTMLSGTDLLPVDVSTKSSIKISRASHL